MLMKLAAHTTAVIAIALTSAACFVEVSDAERGSRPSRGPAPGPYSPPSSAPTEPMLVVVDSGKTMDAKPGEGVGVFVEYTKGGKWHLWWTCDTLRTSKACGFSIKTFVEDGHFEDVVAEGLSKGDVVTAPMPDRIDAVTTTTTTVTGVTFRTAPGATISVDATVSGLHERGFLFFVQGGKPNGGYEGNLTNPLHFRGSTP